tara:strand:+ start:683 stop:976 length:294 start_codon:yes stop_codon:yes gene_type:complete
MLGVDQEGKARNERLMGMLNDPIVQDICSSVYAHAVVEDESMITDDLHERIGVIMSEAVRVSYRLSKEIGLDRNLFTHSIQKLMDIEDSVYRKSVYN